jgi:hypothetical protein
VKPGDVSITCVGCGEVITCPIEVGSGKTGSSDGKSVRVPMRINFAPVRAHHRTTGHKVDGTTFHAPQNVPA